MELICLWTNRAGTCHCDQNLSSLGKIQFIHLRAGEKIIELNFLQVQIHKEIKLNSMADRSIIESYSTFFCFPLSLWLSAWWETCYLNEHEIWIIFAVSLQCVYCYLRSCCLFPIELFQTWCFFTEYPTALKNHHLLLTGLKVKIPKTS